VLSLEMQKAALGGFWGDMDYSDYLWIKFGLVVFAAFIWGIYCGLTGRPLGREQTDKSQSPATHSSER
jgi:hypothetical protein